MKAMKTTLIIFFLGIQSSYSENREEPIEGFADTVQWVITDERVWRIRTYAVDQDVHVHLVAKEIDPSIDYVTLAQANVEKHYGDVLNGKVILHSDKGVPGIEAHLVRHGLGAHLNMGQNGMLFWSPEGTDYRTRSHP